MSIISLPFFCSLFVHDFPLPPSGFGPSVSFSKGLNVLRMLRRQLSACGMCCNHLSQFVRSVFILWGFHRAKYLCWLEVEFAAPVPWPWAMRGGLPAGSGRGLQPYFPPGAGVVSCFTSRRDWMSSLTYGVRHGPDLNPDQTATRALGSFIRPRGPVLWDVPCRTARLPHALGARRTPPFRSRARTCLKWKRPGVCWPPPRFSAFSSHFGRSVFPCELQYLIAELHKMANSFTGIALNLKLTKN